ncbi:hypothetical protein FJZ21_00025 [Candidatus Pacearchaeota archaeon]|nr:hypothetical protein [Candidatus Pacearchaeota archaeon]
MADKKINRLQFALYGIIAIALFVRFYFFNIVKNQAHWWDSLAYGSLAKNMIYHLWDETPFIINETIIRPPLFPIIWSWMLKFGFSDYFLIVFTNIIPSVLAVWLIFLIGKEMYGSRVGLVASALSSVSWIYIFYSSRAMTDIPSMCLILASIYFFVKSYESLNIKNWTISVFCLSFAVLFRYSHAVFAFAFILFLIFVHKVKLVKSKNFWMGGVIGAIPLILFFIINLFAYGSILPATSTYASSAGEKQDFAWYTLGFINHILQSPLVFLFYASLIIILVRTVMSYGFISKHKESRMHIFNLILLLVVLSFFIFVIKASEDRYLLGLSSVFFVLPALVVSVIYDYLANNKKKFAMIVCIAFVLWVAFANLSFANTMMIEKKESYGQMKEAFEWIRYNTPEDSIIAGEWTEPYTIYYAERRVQAFPQDADFSNFTLEADYLIVNVFYPPNEKVLIHFKPIVEQGGLIPIKTFYFDVNQQRPAVIIYQRV